MNVEKMTRKAFLLAAALGVVLAYACDSPAQKKAGYIRKGDAYFEESKYREAIIEYRNALQVDQNAPDVYYKLGLSYLKMGQYQEAFADLSRSVSFNKDNLDAQLKLANLYLANREVSKAGEKARLVLEKDPGNVEGHVVMSAVHLMEKSPDMAVEEARKALDLDPKRISSYINLAQLLVAAKRMDQAEEVLKRAVAVDTRSVPARIALGDFYRILDRHEEAEAEFRRIVELEPGKADPLILLGRLYQSVGKKDEAGKTLEAAVAAEPKNLRARMALADFYRQTGRKDEAAAAYLKAAEVDPTSAKPLVMLAEFHLADKNVDAAEKEVVAALKIDARDIQGLFLKGRIQLLRGQPVEAIATFKSVLAEKRDFAAAHYFLGLAYLANNDVQQGKGELGEAIRLDKGMGEARLALADVNLRTGNSQVALEEAERILQDNPDSYQAHLLAGNAALGRRDGAKAMAHFRELVRLDPRNPAGHHLLGRVLLLKGDFPGAVAELEKALDLNADYYPSLADITAAYIKEKRPDKALERVKKQMAASPRNAAYPQLAGQISDATGDARQAEEYFRKSVGLAPESTSSYLALGNFYARRKMLDKAEGEYQAALRKDPDSLPARMFLGIIYDMRGETPKAREQYEAVLKIKPGFPPAANNLAWIEAESGENLERAFQLAQTARDNYPGDPHVADTLGWIYYRMNVFGRAVPYLEEAAAKLADNAVVRYHLGMTYHKLGRAEDARKELKKALDLDPRFKGADEASKVLAAAAGAGDHP